MSYSTLAQESEDLSIYDKISNEMKPGEKFDDGTKLLTDRYSPDQINEVIYRLYYEIQTGSGTNIGKDYDVAVLIDFICSNELVENAVEACDIVTELPGVTD